MKYLRLHQILFWFLVLATLWFSIGQCSQGRISEAFAQSEIGLEQNLQNIRRINQQLQASLSSLAEFNTEPWLHKIPELERLEMSLRSFHRFVENIRGQLKAAAKNSQTPNDCHLTAKLLLEGSPSLLQQLSHKTDSLRKTMLALVDSAEYTLPAITLDFAAQDNGQYRFQGFSGNFHDMPLSGARAVLADVQMSAAMSLTAVLQYLASRSCVADIRMDYCYPNLLAKKSYVFSGEPFEADIVVGGYEPRANILRIWVNGTGLPVRNGMAHFEHVTRGIGTQSVNAEILGTIPRNGKDGTRLDTFRVARSFSYEVGTRFPNIQLSDAVTYLYQGIENPISYYADGYSHSVLHSYDALLKPATGAGRYTILPGSLQPVKITAGSISSFSFPVRPVPNPEPLLAGMGSGNSIPQNLVAGQTALSTRFPEYFDLEASCQIIGFQLSRFRPRENPAEVDNEGPAFNQQVLALLQSSQPGDRLLFENIWVKCSGDTKPRLIEHLSVRVK